MGNFLKKTWDDIREHPLETVGTIIALPLVASAAGAATVAAPTVMAGMSAYEQKEAADLAKQMGKANAAAAAEYTAEQVRIATEENTRTESLARAKAAASGVSGASTELYLEALKETGRADIDWLKKVGASTYEAELSAGESAYHQARAAMWGSIGAGFSSGMNSVASFF